MADLRKETERSQKSHEDIPDDIIQKQMAEVMFRSIEEDFTRPLNLIYNNCEYLKMHLEREKQNFSIENTTEALSDITNATVHLTRLVDNFIELTKGVEGVLVPTMQAVDLLQMVERLCEDSVTIYNALGIQLKTEITDLDRAFVVADRAFAECICLNLLSNSLNACVEGEEVVFALQHAQDTFVLTVTDNGCGFPPEQVLTAFAPFGGKAKRVAAGLERSEGIGLYLCGEYCRLMGWKIGIECLSPGTRVRIEIPKNQNVYCQNAQLYASEFEQEMVRQATRMAIVRELRCVPGLEGIKR